MFFVLGTVIGSFVNVVAIRIPRGESVVHPPSHCMSCGRRLYALDLIPVLSYVIRRGRCGYCGERFSPVYAWIELGTGLLFMNAAWMIGPAPELIIACVFLAVLVTITLTDLRHMIIPNKVIFFAVFSTVILRLFIHDLPWYDYVIGMVSVSGLLLFIGLLKPEAMGGGDMKLFAYIGLVLGWKLTLLTLMLASSIGLVLSVILSIFRGGFASLKRPIPFGPYIAIGAWVAYSFGEDIWHRYMSLIMMID